MEQSSLELYSLALEVVEVSKIIDSETEDNLGLMEIDEYLEWLLSFHGLPCPPHQKSIDTNEAELEMFLPSPEGGEEKFSSLITIESEGSYDNWLPSLENNSELDQQVASGKVSLGEFSATANAAAEVEEAESRRHANAFAFHGQLQQSGPGLDVERDPNADSNNSGPNSSVGFISDILDGVVFAPVGSSEPPRPSPDTRSRSNLSSFRPTPESEDQPIQAAVTAVTSSINQLEPIKLIRAKSPPLSDFETLFQRELAAKIKKRCQDTQLRQLENSTSAPAGSSTIVRSQSSALPPIPKVVDDPVTALVADVVVAEFENPLYQTLDECYSGSPVLLPAPAPPPPPPLPLAFQSECEEEATYAVIEERDSSHYHTVVPETSASHNEEEQRLYAQVSHNDEEERVYAQVADGVIDDKLYDTVQQSEEIGLDPNAIYENLEELQEREQTYANIGSPSDCNRLSHPADVLTALMLDVEATSSITPASSISRSSNGSSSGNSSTSPEQSTSSPEQLSPADSLANSSMESVRNIGTPDSGVFGLLQPANFSSDSSPLIDTLNNNAKMELDSANQQDFMDQTLKQFEKLEQLSSGIFENSQKQSNKMEDDLLSDRMEEKVALEQTTQAVMLPVIMADDKIMAIQEIPIETLLDLVGSVEPSEANRPECESESEEERVVLPPQMPMSPPPGEPFHTYDPANEDGLFQASLVSVNSQASSSIKESDVSDTESFSKLEEIRSPEPRANLGAQIVEDEVKKMQERDRARNEKLGLDNVGESFERLSSNRYNVISEMTPKTTKRKNWLSSTTDASSDKLDLPPLDGSRRQSGGVNSESILVNKEETKAFWEGKMQSEMEEPTLLAAGRSNRTKMEPQPLQRQRTTLSPPPGFDNDFFDNEQNEAVEQEHEPILSNMEFTDVASITFKSDDSTLDTKPFVIFGSFEDSGPIDEVDTTAPTTAAIAPAPLSDVVPSEAKSQTSHDVRPKSLYFEPERDSSCSDDELETNVGATSFAINKGVHSISPHSNPTETLIEREIRLQREREEAVLLERQKALQILEATRKQAKLPEAAPRKPHMAESNKREGHKVTQSGEFVKKVESKKSTEILVSPAEIRISEEIRELKQREEELRKLRESNVRNVQNGCEDTSSSFATNGATDDEGLYSDAERDVSSSEANSSRVESPEAGLIHSEYSKFPHQRTQSMDSMSSGHSSGDHALTHTPNPSTNGETVKRGGRSGKPIVMPLDDLSDQDEAPAYLRSKETPIEREIRLGREREEALRKEKGLQPGGMTVSAAKQNERENRQGQRFANLNSDKRDVQHRYASSVIQREMDEIAERENELVRDGKIQTTSLERAGSKASSLADYSRKKAVSVLTKPMSAIQSPPTVELALQRSESVVEDRESPSEPLTKKMPQMKVMYGNRGYSNANIMNAAANGGQAAAASATWRNFSNPQGGQRGLMEKFFLSRGRLNSPATFNAPTPSVPTTLSSSSPLTHHSVVTPGSSAGDPVGVMNHSNKMTPAAVRYAAPAVKPVELQTARRDEEDRQVRDKAGPPRRHYATTEEKIQQEFREMQKREEELKLNRSKFFAKSQPNLLDIDDQGVSEPVQRLEGQLRSAHSISDLLADEIQSVEMREELPPMSSSSTVKGARRKSALIAQWENRIHQQDF